MATWASRIGAAGVVRSWDFNTSAQLGDTDLTDNVGFVAGGSNDPEIDLTTPAHPGGGSLKFTVPGLSGANAGGEWWGNFSTDLLTRFGANSEFWVQWRERKNSAMCTVDLTDPGGSTGIKTLILGHQNGTDANPGAANPDVAISSDHMKIVVQTYQHTAATRFPIVYRYHPDDMSNAQLFEVLGGGEFGLENAIPSPFCRYNGSRDGCLMWIADQWDTYTLHVTTGDYDDTTYGNPCFSNSEFQLYIQRPGESRQLVVDWQTTTSGYVELQAWPEGFPWEYGKLWFGPYITNKVDSQSHADMILWISDVIVSSQDIAEVTEESSALATVAAGLSPGQWGTLDTTDIETVCSSDDVGGGASGGIFGYCNKQVWDSITRRFYVSGSDHLTNGSDHVKGVYYDDATNTWEVFRVPDTPNWGIVETSHGNAHQAISATDRYYYTIQYFQSKNAVRRFHIDNLTWDTLPTNSFDDYTATNGGYGSIFFIPNHGLMQVLPYGDGGDGRSELYRFNESTDTWSQIGAGVYDVGTYATWDAYCAYSNLGFFGGGGTYPRKVYKYNPADSTVTACADAPVDFVLSDDSMIVIVGSPTSPYVYAWHANGAMYRYDIVGNSWSTIDAIGTNRFDPVNNRSEATWYVIGGQCETYGVIVLSKFHATDANCNVYVFKPDAADAPAEEPTQLRGSMSMR